MRKPTLATALSLLILTCSTSSFAISLGPGHTLSAIGEPLVAEFVIDDLEPGELMHIVGGPGTVDDFRAEQLSVPFFLHESKGVVARLADGALVLRLTSQQPVQETSVDIMVRASAGPNFVVKRYTLIPKQPGAAGPLPRPRQADTYKRSAQTRLSPSPTQEETPSSAIIREISPQQPIQAVEASELASPPH